MKEFAIIVSCTWKFAATFPVAILVMKMSVTETLIYANLGGALGTFIFVFLSDLLVRTWNNYWPENLKLRRRKNKVFTKRNRRFVYLKTKYGFAGIVILSPVLLSIPLGCFLMVKYYGIKAMNVIWLIAGQVCWSLIYTFLYSEARGIIAG
jgi:hypothetical protein